MEKMKTQTESRMGGIELLLAAATSQPPANQQASQNQPTIALPVDSSALMKQEKPETFMEHNRSAEDMRVEEPKKKKRGRPPGLTKGTDNRTLTYKFTPL